MKVPQYLMKSVSTHCIHDSITTKLRGPSQLSENSNYTGQHRREIAQQYDSKVSDGSTV
ncbi:hypothetical protein T05_15017 [Trichinella murrelli]|uniref:Uncharacterized protein n=1 Tax=Trichinella murrelli TaxID=144512 RepID=A0A0V0SWH0_9BILA|nr:hypothetical protein T05_15017 [Trichinella murrelli]